MKIKFLLLIIVVGIFLPFKLFGQSKPITREDFYSIRREAVLKTIGKTRKVVTVEELFDNAGKVKEIRTDTTEHLPPDKYRLVSVREKDGEIRRNELIKIGKTVYRREGDGETVKSEFRAGGSGFGTSGYSESEYLLETATNDGGLIKVLTEKRVNSDKTFYDEWSTWINEDGLLWREVSKTTFLNFEKVVSIVETSYSYELPGLTIEAPIE